MARITKQFSELFTIISADIFKFCQALSFTPTWQQAELLKLVQAGYPRIAVKSGQGPGKTTVSSAVGLWRALRNPRALTVVTAPTMRQCTQVWMGEVRGHLARADPMLRRLFSVSNTRVSIAGDQDWGIKLVTASKEENAQGYHNENMTIIYEEASGIGREIITQFKGTASNPDCMHLMIGNPNSRDCAFFDCFHSQRKKWACLTWNAEETPETPWFSHQRNKDLEDEFGKTSDVYRVRVLGEFPRTDPQCLLGIEEVEEVMDKSLIVPMSRIKTPGRRGIVQQFGIDLARFGGDESTIFRRSGNAIVEWGYWPRVDPNNIAEKAFVMQKLVEWRDDNVWYVVDAGGLGQGVMRRFYDHNKQVLEFQTQHTAIKSKEYENRMTEAWFHLAHLVKTKQCAIPKDRLLADQLTTRKYGFHPKTGRLMVESKDQYMAPPDNHDSPDRADGLVYAFYDSVEAAAQIANIPNAKHRVGMEVTR